MEHQDTEREREEIYVFGSLLSIKERNKEESKDMVTS
jgi:hypothetical protein